MHAATHRLKPAPLILALLITGYAAFFTTQLLLHYYSFGSRSLDLGNMDQAIWNTLQGRPFHQTNQPGVENRLSLHVEPILLPISLLYLIHSGPETLFVLQSIVVALGAIPVYALARRKLNNDGLGLIFAAVYLMFPAIQAATLLDFHAVTLAPTFLLAAFYYLEIDQPRRFALFAALAAACKEDMALLVLMMGLYALLVNRRPRLGLVTIGLSAGWAFLAVFVIPPALAGTGNVHWSRYSHLGGSSLDILLNLFRRPGLFVDHLQRVDALNYLRLLLSPTAFSALIYPPALLLALPSLGINLLSSFPPMQEVNVLIYAAPAVPAVLIGSIYGVATVRAALRRFLPGLPPAAANVLPGGLLLAASVAYQVQFGYLPGGGQFRGWEEVTEHHRRARRIFAQIPPEAALSAHDRLDPHVSQRETLYIFDRIDDADHIVLDVTEDSWPLHPTELRRRVEGLLAGEFGVVDAVDGYLLLAKNRPDLPKTLPDAFFDFARAPQPASFQPQFPTSVVFDGRLKLVGYDIDLGAHEQNLPFVTLYWQALQPLEADYTIWPFFIDRDGHRLEDPTERPLVTTLWYPTSRWSPGEIVLTRTLPWDLGDEFTLAVGVAEQDWADAAQRLPITAFEESLYTFEQDTWARLATFRRTGRRSYAATIDAAPPAPPPGGAPLAEFASLIRLQDADLPARPLRPGQPLPFTLHWQTGAPISLDLTTFAHLLDEGGNVIAQLDWTPQDSVGHLPTSAWQPGRPVADSQQIDLPGRSGLPPGQYRLVVGWYYQPTGERLPLTAVAGRAQQAGGSVFDVGLVTIR